MSPVVTSPLPTTEPVVDQVAIQLRPGLIAYGGVNQLLACDVANATGEVFCAPYRTLALIDSDQNVFVAVLHGGEWITRTGQTERRTWLSCLSNGLGLNQYILVTLAVSVFAEGGYAEIAMRVRQSDLRTRDALRRLGFRLIGRETWHDEERLIFATRADDNPLWARWLKRRAQ